MCTKQAILELLLSVKIRKSIIGWSLDLNRICSKLDFKKLQMSQPRIYFPPGMTWISPLVIQKRSLRKLHVTKIIFLHLTEDEDGFSRVAGSSIFTFQKVKRSHSMAQTGESLQSLVTQMLQPSFVAYHQLDLLNNRMTHFVFLQTASELARTPGKSVSFSSTPNAEPSTPTRPGRSEPSRTSPCVFGFAAPCVCLEITPVFLPPV